PARTSARCCGRWTASGRRATWPTPTTSASWACCVPSEDPLRLPQQRRRTHRRERFAGGSDEVDAAGEGGPVDLEAVRASGREGAVVQRRHAPAERVEELDADVLRLGH